jgi:hypothetical protein
MLITAKPAADFSRECAGRRRGHLLFVTHPHLSLANQRGRAEVATPRPRRQQHWLLLRRFRFEMKMVVTLVAEGDQVFKLLLRIIFVSAVMDV